MSRTQLFKIRRLVKRGDTEVYEYLKGFSSDGEPEWTMLSMDGEPWANYPKAVNICDMIKIHYRDPHAIFHAVVPA